MMNFDQITSEHWRQHDFSTRYSQVGAESDTLAYKDLGHQPTKDFMPAVTISSVKLGLMVGPGAQVSSLSDYLRWVKGDPKRAVYATPGSGT